MAFGDVVQSNSGTSTTATTAPTLGSATTAGNILVLTFAADDYNGTPNAGWTQSTGMEQQTFHGGYVWWLTATAAMTIPSYTIGSAVRSTWTLVEYAGPFDASPYDISNGQFQQSSSNTYTTPAITPTSGSRLLVAGLNAQQSTTDLGAWGTFTNSFTEAKASLFNGGNPRLAITQLKLVVTANGSTAYSTGGTHTVTSSLSRSGLIIAFKAASGDADANAWRDQVVTNGGTVSAGRLTIIDNFIVAEKAAGTWALTDDYWGLWAENATQALTSLKQRRLATATATPTFTTDRGYAFNGSSQYLNTGFKPATNATVMTGTNMRLAVWEIANVTANTYAAGTADSSTVNLHNRPRSTTSCFAGTSSATITYTLPVADSRGLTAVSRNGAGAANCTAYQNAVAMTQASASTFGSTLPTRDIYIGCYNNIGSAAGFRAASIGFVCVGAALTAGQETSQYNNTQAWAVAVGAATSSGATGTLAVTTEAATVVASAKVVVQATLGVTLGAATGTISGKVTVGGIVTAVLAPAVVVATGTVANSGTLGNLTATLGNATLVATGTVTTPARTGTLAVTLQDATLFAASLPQVFATLNASLDQATLLARGHVPASWTRESLGSTRWNSDANQTERLTEDGHRRVTEDDVPLIRVIEQYVPATWTRQPSSASAGWTKELH